MDFMSSKELNYKKENVTIRLSRCGYTGEDGFEVSVPHLVIESFMNDLLS